MAEFDRRVSTRSVLPGWEAMFHRDDGTAVSAWGATEDRAMAALRDVVEEVEDGA